MRENTKKWRLWGPYLSERQWGTVREDYSANQKPWEYSTHDDARSRAFRWGEDGLAGFSDDRSRLCFGLALWNGRDPILKERYFGLTNREGNHGEDVKELYYFLDATPTHSYLRMLYKYPQAEFPYTQLVQENARRGLTEPEYGIIDTGVFNDGRYFDVFVEFAKHDPEDILIRITVCNRSRETAPLRILPQLWFRNTWAWKEGAPKPRMMRSGGCILAEPEELGEYRLCWEGSPTVLFCENESNGPRLWGVGDPAGVYKDAFHEYVVNGRRDAVNPKPAGSKAGLLYETSVPAGSHVQLRLRLVKGSPPEPFGLFDAILERRHEEADVYYAELQKGIEDEDKRRVQRQALAGMIWSKQFYYYDVPEWLNGDPAQPPPPPEHVEGRNSDWKNVNTADILSMPDTWEYPWYAAWDSAFHTIPLSLIDAEYAKNQLILLLREWYMHPDGQLPAYEWNFGDVNPPVHAWAAWRLFQIDRKQQGKGDLAFLERVFHKLLLNFTWWVNRKDPDGRNIFRGGFLGLDNIGVFDRSKPLPTGGYISQADATSWMAMYCLNMLRISLELALHNHVYEDIATKFFEHFLSIAEAMTDIGEKGIGLWDEQEGFFYDELNLPDGSIRVLKVRSLVGLIPLFAVETIEPEMLACLPDFARRLEWYLNYRPGLASLVSRWNEPGRGERRLLSLLRGHRMKCLLSRMLNPNEFLSDYGVRSLSKYHETHPFVFHTDDGPFTVDYVPGDSNSRLFGGNSNWRGPVWFPMNYLIIESLQKFHYYYGDDFKIECPTGSGNYTTIYGVSMELTRRLERIFLRDEQGRRAVFGEKRLLQDDPNFRDHVLFHEFFHGDLGSGLGASHQTGWTALIAKLLHPKEEPVH
jgi:hypothetical protein